MNTMSYPNWRKKAFTMSYDDGVEQDIQLIEIMKKYGVKGTFNLNSYALQEEEHTYPEGTLGRRMGRKLARETYLDSGMEVAVHTHTHPFLNKLQPDLAIYEVIKDREILESVFERPVYGMAYPMGTTSDETVELLKKCGIVYARTVVSTGGFDIPIDWLRLPATCHHDDPKAVEYAESF